MLFKLILVNVIQFWGSAKPTNISRIQAYQSKTLRQITKAPYYVSNHILYHNLFISFVANVAKTRYKRFQTLLFNYKIPLTNDFFSLSIPSDPQGGSIIGSVETF